jgi:hypothetical protein
MHLICIVSIFKLKCNICHASFMSLSSGAFLRCHALGCRCYSRKLQKKAQGSNAGRKLPNVKSALGPEVEVDFCQALGVQTAPHSFSQSSKGKLLLMTKIIPVALERWTRFNCNQDERVITKSWILSISSWADDHNSAL